MADIFRMAADALDPPDDGEFEVTLPDDTEATLVVNVTDEGVILDVIVDGEVVQTWGRTAQEIVETFWTKEDFE